MRIINIIDALSLFHTFGLIDIRSGENYHCLGILNPFFAGRIYQFAQHALKPKSR
jgi:hypothetical protein